jgi:uncharacterized protein DUF1501
LSRDLDNGLAELIGDMEKIKSKDRRSLLDRTLIVSMGEFGRTPGDITVNKDRDHHRFAMSGLFAGAGVAGGRALMNRALELSDPAGPRSARSILRMSLLPFTQLSASIGPRKLPTPLPDESSSTLNLSLA